MIIKRENKLNKNSKIKFKVMALVLVCVCSFCFMGCSENMRNREIVKLINKHAIYATDIVTKEQLASSSVEEILYNDHYAKLYSKEEYAQIIQQNAGNYSGFGLSFLKDTLTVYSTTINSPAEIAGIKAGDVIVAVTVNGVRTETRTFEDLSSAISVVKTNEEAIFSVRTSDLSVKDITLKRTEYKAGYVTYIDNERELKVRTYSNGDFYLQEFAENKNTALTNDTAYISLTEFNGKASEQLQLALNEVKNKNKTSVILDLRDNGGGSLDILTDICEQLLPTSVKKGSPIMFVQYKNSQDKFTIDKNGKNDYINKLIVLANENTASASEALIGVLNCYGVGGFNLSNLIVEYNSSRNDYSTFGKGIMQTTYRLTTGGALKMTTAKIYWPDQVTCIHDIGVVPTESSNQVEKGEAINRAISLLY